MACLRLFTVPPLPPLPLFNLPRLNLCISRSTSLEALGEYFLVMRNPPQGMRDPLVKWVTRETKSRTRKMKNKIFAIPPMRQRSLQIPKRQRRGRRSKTLESNTAWLPLLFPKRRISCRLRFWGLNHNRGNEVPTKRWAATMSQFVSASPRLGRRLSPRGRCKVAGRG